MTKRLSSVLVSLCHYPPLGFLAGLGDFVATTLLLITPSLDDRLQRRRQADEHGIAAAELATVLGPVVVPDRIPNGVDVLLLGAGHRAVLGAADRDRKAKVGLTRGSVHGAAGLEGVPAGKD